MATKNEKPEQVETKPYKVISNLRHGGKHYAPNATVELTAKEAETLKALNVIESK